MYINKATRSSTGASFHQQKQPRLPPLSLCRTTAARHNTCRPEIRFRLMFASAWHSDPPAMTNSLSSHSLSYPKDVDRMIVLMTFAELEDWQWLVYPTLFTAPTVNSVRLKPRLGVSQFSSQVEAYKTQCSGTSSPLALRWPLSWISSFRVPSLQGIPHGPPLALPHLYSAR